MEHPMNMHVSPFIARGSYPYKGVTQGGYYTRMLSSLWCSSEFELQLQQWRVVYTTGVVVVGGVIMVVMKGH